MSRLLAAVVPVVATALLGGCGFTEKSAEFACDTAADCDGGRVCTGGFCVLGDLPDADPNAPDADPADIDAGMTECGDGTCVAGEDPTNCIDDCGVCDFSCTTGACAQVCGLGSTCSPTCQNSCTCDIDCSDANNCNALCRDGTDCDIDCSNANNCDQVRCRNGSRCLIKCTGATACNFEQCVGGSGQQSCPDDIIVCNRDCP